MREGSSVSGFICLHACTGDFMKTLEIVISYCRSKRYTYNKVMVNILLFVTITQYCLFFFKCKRSKRNLTSPHGNLAFHYAQNSENDTACKFCYSNTKADWPCDIHFLSNVTWPFESSKQFNQV